MKEGHFDRHIRKMKRIYKQRREALGKSLKEHFPDCVLLGHAAGMHLVVEIPGITIHTPLLDWIQKQGVLIYSVEHYSLVKNTHANKIVLGYGSLPIEKIEEGVKRLKLAIESYS